MSRRYFQSLGENVWMPLTEEATIDRCLRLVADARHPFFIVELHRGDDAPERSDIGRSQEYLQTIGSVDGFVIEIQYVEGRDVRHCVVGVPGGSLRDRGSPVRTFVGNDGRVRIDVADHEVFSFESASSTFIHYFRNGVLPSESSVRELPG